MPFTATAIARLLLSIAVGSAVGMAVYTFTFARGASYLTDVPAACAICYIMNEHYGGWLKSTHHPVALLR